MNEVWKDVEGYEGLYQVSSEGNVFSLRRRRKVSLHNTSNGYMQVHLWKGGKPEYLYVHRLVATAFCERVNAEDIHVNHKDENRKNNAASNLEWCTNKYNHVYGNYRQKQFETKRKNGKTTAVFQYAPSGELVAKYDSMHKAAEATGVPRHAIKSAGDSGLVSRGYYWILK